MSEWVSWPIWLRLSSSSSFLYLAFSASFYFSNSFIFSFRISIYPRSVSACSVNFYILYYNCSTLLIFLWSSSLCYTPWLSFFWSTPIFSSDYSSLAFSLSISYKSSSSLLFASSSGMKLPGFLLILLLYFYLSSAIFCKFDICSSLVFNVAIFFYNANYFAVEVVSAFSERSILYLASILLRALFFSANSAFNFLFYSLRVENKSSLSLSWSLA